MTNEAKNYLLDAFATWLRTSADLVSLTGYADPTNYSIRVDNGDEVPQVPGVMVVHEDSLPMFTHLDGAYVSLLVARCFAHDAATARKIAGTVEVLGAQNATTHLDASFSDSHVRTLGIRTMGLRDVPSAKTPRRSGEQTPDLQPNVYEADTAVMVHWLEK